MQVETPQIRWHSGPTGLNEAVMSIDFLGGGNTGDESFHVLATAGADREIKIWQVKSRTRKEPAVDGGEGQQDVTERKQEDKEEKDEQKSEKEELSSSEKASGMPRDGVAAEQQDPTSVDGTIDLTIEKPNQHQTQDKEKQSESDITSNANNKTNTSLEFIFSLSGHERSINCVRFSPNGHYLASASDDSTIILWSRPKGASENWSWANISSNSEVSRTLLTCGHVGDITDLAWSPDSCFLCSTSVDNCCLIWNVEKGVVEERRKDHTQYVQGAAWDPLNEFLVTEGNDRSCRVYSLQGFDMACRTTGKRAVHKCICAQTIKSRAFACSQPSPPSSSKDPQETKDGDAPIVPPKHKMFVDDTFPAFARRPTWTPDGSYLLLPTGLFKRDQNAETVNTVYGFARGNMEAPSVHLAGQEKPSLGVRCSPLLYPLRESSSNLFEMPLRSVFAVATLNAVVVYDTQQLHPLCSISGIHYAALTDICWSSDGLTLAIASLDGYITFVRFEKELFGAPLDRIEQMEMVRTKAKSMMVTPKPTRKKPRNDDAKSPAISKKKQQVAQPPQDSAAAIPAQAAPNSGGPHYPNSPLRKAFQAAPVKAATTTSTPQTTAPPAVHMLQVRKKRRITPVAIATTTPTPSSSSSSSNAAPASCAVSSGPANQSVIDLSADSTLEPGPHDSQLSKEAQQQSEQKNQAQDETR